MAHYKILTTFNGVFDGQLRHVTEGEVIELTESEARAFVECGFMTEEKPAVKVVHKQPTGKAVK